MSKLMTVTKNEFYRYFISPLAYVYLISFLVLNGSFALYFGHFFEQSQASLQPMFAFQPWLYLLFIPGISMRLWSEEFRNKTILQIITMPVSIPALVWGKFLASWAFCAVALALTFPFWLTVNWLGNPDNAVIFISYIGSFLLAGCMLAISQTMSALTKNQVIALVLAVITNLIFFLSGIEYVLGFVRSLAPLSFVDMIASFSFLTHFDTISRGLVEARDLVFFASVILLFNFTTTIIISFKTSGTSALLKSTRRNYYILAFLLLLIGFCGLNLLANNLLRRIQYDFTEEKIFTLTPSTKKVLHNLQEPVTAKLYYSRILGERNPEFRLMFDKVRLLLQQYAALSNGRFDYQIYYPEALSDAEDLAIASGLQPLPVIDNSTNAYFGLVFTDEVEQKEIIPFFPLERSNLIEQDLTQTLYLLHHTKKKLGIITSLPMFATEIDNMVTSEWEITKQLSKTYEIVDIKADDIALPDIDVLMLAHPRNLSPELLNAIKNYSYKGGKILAFMDIAAEAPLIFAPMKEPLAPSSLNGLEQIWGIKFNDKEVVGDLANSSVIDATTDYKNNPTFTQDVIQFYLQGDSFNRKFKETALLKKMLVSSAGTFEVTKPDLIYFIPLLQPSHTSALLPAKVVYQNIHPSDILRKFEPDAATKYIGARIISKDNSHPFELIVVGDSDLLYDNFWTTHKVMLERNISIPILDNANFVLNALDTLSGDDTLIGLRGKSDLNRNFEQIEITRKIAQQKFKIQEKEILDEIEHIRNGLREIWAKKTFEERVNFTPDELAIIANIRKDVNQQRLKLLQLKNDINKPIERIGTWVNFINIYSIPLLIILILGIMLLRKHRRDARTVDIRSPFKLNRQLMYLGLIAAALLVLGIISVYYNNHREIADYEGRKFFAELPSQINKVESIRLQSHASQLHFFKKDGIWQLEDYPQYAVYQDRIRSFLSALLEATYFEKKSAKVENLSQFGLAPVAQKGSPNIRVELDNTSGKMIESFEVGKYNIDLGRGSMGAYLKFDNKFQVWLVAIELIDLSTDWQEWTYSTMWNLRFGRFAEVDNITNSDKLALIAKTMLNTTLDNPRNRLQNANAYATLNFKIEGNESLSLHFFTEGNKYLINYEFAEQPQNSALALFAAASKGIYYEINKEKFDEIFKTLEQ